MLVLAVSITPVTAQATKYEIWKPPVLNQDTGSIEHPAPVLDWLAKVHATVLAVYPTTTLIEAPAVQHNHVLDLAAENGIVIRPRPEYDEINISGNRFTSTGTPVIVDPALRLDDYEGDAGLYIVQLIGPNRPEWEARLQGLAAVIHYYPENTYLVRMSPAAQEAAAALDFVQHLSVYQPAFKMAAGALRDSTRRYVVQLDSALAQRSKHGVIQQLVHATADDAVGAATLITARATLSREAVIDLVRQPEVIWVEPSLTGDFSDERQANIVAGNHNGRQPTNPGTYHTWLANSGFCTSTSSPPGCYDYWTKVGHFDSGIDENICATDGGTCMGAGDTRDRHADLGDREGYFFCGTANGCLINNEYHYSDQVGHGTNTASIIAGDPQVGTGDQDNDDYFLGTGIAPLAETVSVRLGGSQGFFADYTAAELAGLVDDVRSVGARVINNSWNYNTFNDDTALGYTTVSQKYDELVRDASGGFNQYNHPMSIVFSAGNHDGGGENTYNPDYAVEAPGNAKNIITAGSSESYRTTDFLCYPATDIKNIAAYSLRGVAYDSNRYKPDLVAPSTRNAAAETQLTGTPADDYNAFCGTSAAAPVITGAAVLAEAWYYYENGYTLPSPAMIKAMLVAHADDIQGGTDNVTSQTIGRAPWLSQGWGRVNLDNLFQCPDDVRFFDEDHTVGGARRFTSGEGSWTVNLTVDNANHGVIVALVFTDRYAAAGAYALKVNDLDVYVIDGAYSYQGNDFKSDGYTFRATGHWLPDDANNIELIRIPAGEIVNNDFTIEVVPYVSAKAVPGLDGAQSNQDFALYVVNAN